MGTTRYVYNHALSFLNDEEKRIKALKETQTEEDKEDVKERKKALKENKQKLKNELEERQTELKILKLIDSFLPRKEKLSFLKDTISENKEYKNSSKAEIKAEQLEVTDLQLSKNKVRDRFVTEKDNPWVLSKKWMTKTPKDIRAGAVEDLFDAKEAAHVNLTKGNIKSFKLRYRKKGEDKSIKIPDSAIKTLKHTSKKRKKSKKPRYKLRIYPKYLKSPVKCCINDKSLKCLENIDHTYRLELDHNK